MDGGTPKLIIVSFVENKPSITTESTGKRKMYETSTTSSSNHMSSSSHHKIIQRWKRRLWKAVARYFNQLKYNFSVLLKFYLTITISLSFQWIMFCALLLWYHWSRTLKHPNECYCNSFCCPPEQGIQSLFYLIQKYVFFDYPTNWFNRAFYLPVGYENFIFKMYMS